MIYNLSGILSENGVSGTLLAWQGEKNKKAYIAKKMIDKAVAKGKLRPGQPIVEMSTGNMAKYAAEEAAKIGSQLTVFGHASLRERLPENVNVLAVPNDVACGGNLRKKRLSDYAKQYAAENGAYYLGQFENPDHIESYKELMVEIWTQNELPHIDAYVDAAGTGATVRGVGEVLKQRNAGVKIICCSYTSEHSEGVSQFFGDEFLPDVYNPSMLPTQNNIVQALERLGITRFNHSLRPITVATAWLRDNPGKTAFIFMGD